MAGDTKPRENTASKKASTEKLARLICQLKPNETEDVAVIAKKMLRKRSRGR